MKTKPHLNQDIWQKYVAGWQITDCAIREKNAIYLCLRQDLPDEVASRLADHDILTELMAIYLDSTDDQYGVRTLTGYNKPRLGVAEKPLKQGLLVARNGSGQVSVVGGGGKWPDEFIHKDGWPIPMRIKCINGYAYSVGANRKIYKRIDIGKWVRFADLKVEGDIFTVGFNDMDAFSETDMYAVGGHGDVWHYDGKEWKRTGFPTNMQLGTVTCAGDGNVYVSGEGGSLWMGRESTWKRIHKGESTILWNDVLWFENKLWLASDYQFRVWDGKALQHVTHQGKRIYITGHMDARDGLLIVASPSEVMAYDGQSWRVIVAPYG